MISLKQIHYALAVERNLHFKRAAEECNISQSALSTALGELEKQLGFQIFERDNRKVLVTPLGQQVLERARAIELQMEDLLRLADAQRDPLSTQIHLGVIPPIGPYLLPRVLPALQEEFPKLRWDIVEDQSAELGDMLRRGALDAAILALPYPIDGLLSFSFWQEDLKWVAHRSAVSKGLKQADEDTIAESHLMLLKDGHCLKDHALSACRLEDDSVHSFSATSLATLVQLVSGKMGSTLIPELALEQLIGDTKDLAVLPLADPGPHRDLAIVIRPNYPGMANVEALLQLFKRELSSIQKR